MSCWRTAERCAKMDPSATKNLSVHMGGYSYSDFALSLAQFWQRCIENGLINFHARNNERSHLMASALVARLHKWVTTMEPYEPRNVLSASRDLLLQAGIPDPLIEALYSVAAVAHYQAPHYVRSVLFADYRMNSASPSLRFYPQRIDVGDSRVSWLQWDWFSLFHVTWLKTERDLYSASWPLPSTLLWPDRVGNGSEFRAEHILWRRSSCNHAPVLRDAVLISWSDQIIPASEQLSSYDAVAIVTQAIFSDDSPNKRMPFCVSALAEPLFPLLLSSAVHIVECEQLDSLVMNADVKWRNQIVSSDAPCQWLREFWSSAIDAGLLILPPRHGLAYKIAYSLVERVSSSLDVTEFWNPQAVFHYPKEVFKAVGVPDALIDALFEAAALASYAVRNHVGAYLLSDQTLHCGIYEGAVVSIGESNELRNWMNWNRRELYSARWLRKGELLDELLPFLPAAVLWPETMHSSASRWVWNKRAGAGFNIEDDHASYLLVAIRRRDAHSFNAPCPKFSVACITQAVYYSTGAPFRESLNPLCLIAEPLSSLLPARDGDTVSVEFEAAERQWKELMCIPSSKHPRAQSFGDKHSDDGRVWHIDKRDIEVSTDSVSEPEIAGARNEIAAESPETFFTGIQSVDTILDKPLHNSSPDDEYVLITKSLEDSSDDGGTAAQKIELADQEANALLDTVGDAVDDGAHQEVLTCDVPFDRYPSTLNKIVDVKSDDAIDLDTQPKNDIVNPIEVILPDVQSERTSHTPHIEVGTEIKSGGMGERSEYRSDDNRCGASISAPFMMGDDMSIPQSPFENDEDDNEPEVYGHRLRREGRWEVRYCAMPYKLFSWRYTASKVTCYLLVLESAALPSLNCPNDSEWELTALRISPEALPDWEQGMGFRVPAIRISIGQTALHNWAQPVAAILRSAPPSCPVKWLNVNAVTVTDAAAVVLADALKHAPSLYTVNVLDARLSDVGCCAILSALANNGGTGPLRLDFSDNGIRVLPWPLLQQLLPRLHTLSLNGNNSLLFPPRAVTQDLDIGGDDVVSFLRLLRDTGAELLPSVNVMLVGHGGAGKSSLYRQMFQADLPPLPHDYTTWQWPEMERFLQCVNCPSVFVELFRSLQLTGHCLSPGGSQDVTRDMPHPSSHNGESNVRRNAAEWLEGYGALIREEVLKAVKENRQLYLSTPGIISNEARIPGTGAEIWACVYDYAGQLQYYASHELHLAKQHTLFLVTVKLCIYDSERECWVANHKLYLEVEYWLRYLQTLLPRASVSQHEAAVLLVFTHADIHQTLPLKNRAALPHIRDLQSQFPDLPLQRVLAVNAHSNTNDVIKEMRNWAVNLQQQIVIPAFYTSLNRRLMQEFDLCFSGERKLPMVSTAQLNTMFCDHCERFATDYKHTNAETSMLQQTISGYLSVDAAVRYLVATGVLLPLRESDKYLLYPLKWFGEITTAFVYDEATARGVVPNDGGFVRLADLQRYSAALRCQTFGEVTKLLQILVQYHLCVPTLDSQIVFPPVLPTVSGVDRSVSVEHMLSTMSHNDPLYFGFRIICVKRGFMLPPSLFLSFLARLWPYLLTPIRGQGNHWVGCRIGCNFACATDGEAVVAVLEYDSTEHRLDILMRVGASPSEPADVQPPPFAGLLLGELEALLDGYGEGSGIPVHRYILCPQCVRLRYAIKDFDRRDSLVPIGFRASRLDVSNISTAASSAQAVNGGWLKDAAHLWILPRARQHLCNLHPSQRVLPQVTFAANKALPVVRMPSYSNQLRARLVLQERVAPLVCEIARLRPDIPCCIKLRVADQRSRHTRRFVVHFQAEFELLSLQEQDYDRGTPRNAQPARQDVPQGEERLLVIEELEPLFRPMLRLALESALLAESKSMGARTSTSQLTSKQLEQLLNEDEKGLQTHAAADPSYTGEPIPVGDAAILCDLFGVLFLTARSIADLKAFLERRPDKMPILMLLLLEQCDTQRTNCISETDKLCLQEIYDKCTRGSSHQSMQVAIHILCGWVVAYSTPRLQLCWSLIDNM